MTIIATLNQIQALHQQIYDYFGYVEDWTVLPFDDCTDHFWRLTNDTVEFADEIDQLGEDDGYINYFYHGSKSVCRGEQFTMVAVDTHCDGNKFLQIFDNTKEIK